MVIDQDITMRSAEANSANAVLAREAAEYSLAQYMEIHDGPQRKALLSEMPEGLSPDQSCHLPNFEADEANAGARLLGMIQKLDGGTSTDAAVVGPNAIFAAVKQYMKTVENHVAAIQASRIAQSRGPLDKEHLILQSHIDKARGRERVKQLILSYEKAYLKSLSRERAKAWW